MASQPNPRPLLSVLIPTRNRHKYLPFAIQSALNVPSSEIEIIVSENHSEDCSLEVCRQFSDSRLRVLQPQRPLAMHDNWEFLLAQANGRWITFIGDDDAVMPHCVDHLRFLDLRYPQAEAIFSPRAYFFWPGCEKTYGDVAVNAWFMDEHRWIDSKRQLQAALRGKIPYISLPQMYSGGFQRRSLVNRVRRVQGGAYFRSVTPDAYSALMACIHTYRYVQTGVPITWVGTSPDRQTSDIADLSKDREKDFHDLLTEDSLVSHPALGDLRKGTFLIYLFEAYISAFPATSAEMLSLRNVRRIFLQSVKELRAAGRDDVVEKLSKDLGFPVPGKRFAEWAAHASKRVAPLQAWLLKALDNTPLRLRRTPSYGIYSTSRAQFPHILACDDRISELYAQCVDTGKG